MTRASKRKTTKPANRRILFPVMWYDDIGQLTVPKHLNLGSDGKLYLTRSCPVANPKEKTQPVSLKESFAWFRLGHDYNLILTKGQRFSEWLKMVEQGLN